MDPKPPIAFIVAVLASASPMLFALLMDAMRAPGGDGYQGFGTGLLFGIVALALTIGGIAMGFRRKEKHQWLAFVALAQWLMPFGLMI